MDYSKERFGARSQFATQEQRLRKELLFQRLDSGMPADEIYACIDTTPDPNPIYPEELVIRETDRRIGGRTFLARNVWEGGLVIGDRLFLSLLEINNRETTIGFWQMEPIIANLGQAAIRNFIGQRVQTQLGDSFFMRVWNKNHEKSGQVDQMISIDSKLPVKNISTRNT